MYKTKDMFLTILEILSTSTASTTIQEITHLKSTVAESMRKVSHLTSLLNESEANNVKLEQLCDTLKEVIRNKERNIEREQHLEHSEYVKNIIFKVHKTLTHRLSLL